MRERLALALMSNIASHFAYGRPPWTLQDLTQHLAIPMHSVNVVLDALEEGGFLVKSHDDPPAYLPSRDLADVSVADVIGAVRRAGEDRYLDLECLTLPMHAEELATRMEWAMLSPVQNVSVKALASELSPLPLRTESPAEVAPREPLVTVSGMLKS
jgi:membrane protein